MRTFGVEEELLLLDAATLVPVPVAEQMVALKQHTAPSGHEITLEFKQEQIEVVSAPQTTFIDQLATIRSGRRAADIAATKVGARAVALATAPGAIAPALSHLTTVPRYHAISEHCGLTATEQLTCALHVHVQVSSREEGVAVLDRIRGWLPTLLALGANSPFWQSNDTGFASYRYQAWNRWPMTGPTEMFGSVAAYDRWQEALLSTNVPLDEGMFYFDARLCERHSTVEVRVADVCLDAEHSAVIATMIRALVETTARAWQSGSPAPPIPVSLLRAWSWQASRYGLSSQLINPATGRPAPAADMVTALVATISPVLTEYGEHMAVQSVIADILAHGSGASRQRKAYAIRHDLGDVASLALQLTHQDTARAAQTLGKRSSHTA